MKLTTRQFEAVLENTTKFTQRTRDMARAVLVDRASPATVADDFGVSRQAVHKAANRVYKAYLAQVECPEGWQVMEVRLPPELAKQVKELEREQLAMYTAQQT